MSTASATSRCPQCGEKNEESLSRCRACGAALTVNGAQLSQPAFELRLLSLRSPPLSSRSLAAGSPRPSFLRRACVALEAAGETAVAIALKPDASFRAFRLDGGMARPLAYSVLLGGPSLLLGVAAMSLLAREGDGLSGLEALALLLLVPPAYVYLRAHVIHLVLVFRGEALAPFEATFRVAAYANASVAPLLLLPYAGELLFLAAGAAVEATGLRVCHRLSLSSAALAEVVPALMLVIGLAAAIVTGLLWWSQTRG